MPISSEKYTNLEHMLTHLQLKKGKQGWQACECPLRPRQQTEAQIWKLLLQTNKNPEQEQQNIPKENRTAEQHTRLPQKTTNEETNKPKYKNIWEALQLAEIQNGNGNSKYRNAKENTNTNQH